MTPVLTRLRTWLETAGPNHATPLSRHDVETLLAEFDEFPRLLVHARALITGPNEHFLPSTCSLCKQIADAK